MNSGSAVSSLRNFCALGEEEEEQGEKETEEKETEEEGWRGGLEVIYYLMFYAQSTAKSHMYRAKQNALLPQVDFLIHCL